VDGSLAWSLKEAYYDYPQYERLLESGEFEGRAKFNSTSTGVEVKELNVPVKEFIPEVVEVVEVIEEVEAPIAEPVVEAPVVEAPVVEAPVNRFSKPKTSKAKSSPAPTATIAPTPIAKVEAVAPAQPVVKMEVEPKQVDNVGITLYVGCRPLKFNRGVVSLYTLMQEIARSIGELNQSNFYALNSFDRKDALTAEVSKHVNDALTNLRANKVVSYLNPSTDESIILKYLMEASDEVIMKSE
jgi:hypothetical protein